MHSASLISLTQGYVAHEFSCVSEVSQGGGLRSATPPRHTSHRGNSPRGRASVSLCERLRSRSLSLDTGEGRPCRHWDVVDCGRRSANVTTQESPYDNVRVAQVPQIPPHGHLTPQTASAATPTGNSRTHTVNNHSATVSGDQTLTNHTATVTGDQALTNHHSQSDSWCHSTQCVPPTSPAKSGNNGNTGVVVGILRQLSFRRSGSSRERSEDRSRHSSPGPSTRSPPPRIIVKPRGSDPSDSTGTTLVTKPPVSPQTTKPPQSPSPHKTTAAKVKTPEKSPVTVQLSPACNTRTSNSSLQRASSSSSVGPKGGSTVRLRHSVSEVLPKPSPVKELFRRFSLRYRKKKPEKSDRQRPREFYLT